MINFLVSDEHWDVLGVCLSKIPAFFEFLNKLRCNSPVYHIADSIIRKLIIDVSIYAFIILFYFWRIIFRNSYDNDKNLTENNVILLQGFRNLLIYYSAFSYIHIINQDETGGFVVKP